MQNNVLVFNSPETARDTYVAAMLATLIDKREPILSTADAYLILRREGWTANEIAAYADAAIHQAEVFNRKVVDIPAVVP